MKRHWMFVVIALAASLVGIFAGAVIHNWLAVMWAGMAALYVLIFTAKDRLL